MRLIFKGFSLPRSRVLQYLTMNFKVFVYCSELLRKCFRNFQNARTRPPTGLLEHLWEPKLPRKNSQEAPKASKRTGKWSPRDRQGAPKGPQDVPEGLQVVPKGSPRDPRGIPKSPQGVPKRSPRGLQGAHKESQRSTQKIPKGSTRVT